VAAFSLKSKTKHPPNPKTPNKTNKNPHNNYQQKEKNQNPWSMISLTEVMFMKKY